MAKTGDDQWREVCEFCELSRAKIRKLIANVAQTEARHAGKALAAKAMVGVALATIIEAGDLIHAIAPSAAGTAWENEFLATLRGALRGAGRPVDEDDANRSHFDA